MDDSCLYLDWLLTVLLTVFALVVYCIPRERYHPMLMLVLAWSFFSWPLQFFFLEYGVSTLKNTGHADLVLLLIPVMAIVVVALLWCLRCFIVLVLTMLIALMISQTQLIDISIPISFAIGVMVWLLLWYSSVSNIVQGFVVSVYTAGNLTFGLASMILETSTPTNSLTPSCSEHFNMWLTCDVDCSSIVVFDTTGARLGVGFAFLALFVLRLLIQWIFTKSFYRKPKLKSSCCCCDLVQYNDDNWISLADRQGKRRNSDVDEDDAVALVFAKPV